MSLRVCVYCPAFLGTCDASNWRRHTQTKSHLRRKAGLPVPRTRWHCHVCDYTAGRSDHFRSHCRTARHHRNMERRRASRVRRPAMVLDTTRYV
jgi:hypothetical protein